MPYSETRAVLNQVAIEGMRQEVRGALRKLFPNLIITEREGEGSQMVLDVQSLKVDFVLRESYFQSKGEEVIDGQSTTSTNL